MAAVLGHQLTGRLRWDLGSGQIRLGPVRGLWAVGCGWGTEWGSTTSCLRWPKGVRFVAGFPDEGRAHGRCAEEGERDRDRTV